MKPFEVFRFRDDSNLTYLTERVRESLVPFGFPNHASLRELHQYLAIKDLNDARLSCFNNLNASNWYEVISSELLSRAQACLGPDLLIQKSINVSIQLPNDETSILPIHSDCNSGDSPYQLNIWIPLGDVFGTASMFILDAERSIKGIKKIIEGGSLEITPRDDDFVKLRYGEYLIFHPAFLHGNTVNLTNITRISLNLRFASIPLECLSSADISRSFGAYYRVWCESKWKSLSDMVVRALEG